MTSGNTGGGFGESGRQNRGRCSRGPRRREHLSLFSHQFSPGFVHRRGIQPLTPFPGAAGPVVGRSGSADQIRTVPSPDPEAIRVPSGLMSTP